MPPMNIDIRPLGIVVKDGSIEYSIHRHYPHNINYDDNIIIIPFVTDMIASCGDNYRDVVLENHDSIVEQLRRLINVISDLPILNVCRPLLSRCVFTYHLYRDANGNNIYFEDDRIVFYTADRIYCVHLYLGYTRGKSPMDVTIVSGTGVNIHYPIDCKVMFNNDPFDAGVFTQTVSDYLNDHLSVLFRLFTVNNVKSARN